LQLRFAFDELNLYPLSIETTEYSLVGRRFADRFGFCEESCRRPGKTDEFLYVVGSKLRATQAIRRYSPALVIKVEI
jgi:hypothetical protein